MENRKEEAKFKKEDSKINTENPKKVEKQNLIIWFSLAMSIIAIMMAAYSLLHIPSSQAPVTSFPSSPAANTTLSKIVVNGSLFIPPASLSNAPIVTQNQSFGSRLTNINEPLNGSELAIFNNASNVYFEKAGMMLLNNSINNVGIQTSASPLLIVNGKPSVIYLGAISCFYCSENRWAMGLALGRFGKFNMLFKGYSSFGDADLPTIYWAPAEYNSTSAADFGNFYNSNYINFLSIEYASQIRSGFEMQPLSFFVASAKTLNSTPYLAALNLILKLNNFQGTPYTIWGRYVSAGVDAVDLGNINPTQPPIPLEYMTHEQVLAQLANPNDTFAWREYAAADLYIAMTCASINNTAPVCSLPAIQQIEKINGY
ncbi:MAG: DUF929 family protein [Candidatus Micrarchaeia archaeon]